MPALVLLAALLVPLTALADTAARTPITHEKLWMMKRVGAPVVSPDGKWLVFPVLEPAYDQEKDVNELWLTAADGNSPPRRLTHAHAGEKGVVWSPDSHAIAFSAKREGDDAEQIYILELSAGGGEARRITSLSTGARSPQWRPDGKAILFESSVYPGAPDDEANKKIAAEHKARKYHVREYQHFPVRYWNEWLDDHQPTILVQSLEEGATPKDILSPTALAHSPGFGAAPAAETAMSLSPNWSPDGKEVIFTATTERWNAAFAHVGYHLYRLAAEGGAEPALITPASGNYAQAMFAPDGHSLFFKYAPQDAEIYHLERLMRVPWPAGGEPSLVTHDFDRDVSSYAVTADGRSVYLLVPESGLQGLYRVAAAGGDPAHLFTPKVGGYSALTIARKSAHPVLIANYGSSVNPDEVVSLDPGSGHYNNLTHIDTAAAAAIDWQPPEHFYFTSAKGRSIHNMIFLPPAFDAGKRYPLLVLIHGGPASYNADQIGLRWNPHLLAAPGYVVLATDYTGSTSFGEKFAQQIKLDPLKTPGDELNQAVDEALRRFPYIDGSRMCAAGASYGGHLAYWLEATTTRFRCIVAHAGEVDLTTQWGESDFNYGRELGNGGPPWAGNPIWHEQSAISYADHWKTPILLSIGERDYRVPIGNTLEAWSTLQRMQVPSRLLVWPDAWHWILRPEDSRHFYEEVHAWLAKYLKGEEPAAARP
ncbi:MAG TPA: S9 family peptidase [Steroidobacteraceae bacterium]|jgi:dipeptidyl aminopeptidase/acylaminoacyl peptidase|nr:S9 family peptidase [Steroidobacteraceae bacterium]